MKKSNNIIEELLPDLFRIEVPLPGSPLKSINSYVIQGNERWLIIDTAMNRNECLVSLRSALRQLKVNLGHTDFFITHFHVDHLGLASTLAGTDSRIYLSPVESVAVANFGPSRWQNYLHIFVANGFPQDEFSMAVQSSPGSQYGVGPKRLKPDTLIYNNDLLTIGDFQLTAIYTPGHSPCHTCLYEKKKKILFSGDHVLFDITPNIAYSPELKNPLGHYLNSLKMINDLDVHLVLPGHGLWRNDLKSRIGELQIHHNQRLDEVLAALQDGEKTAYQVAPFLWWEVKADSWQDFPVMQKYFAVGETIAHLHYLQSENRVKQRLVDGQVLYSLF